MTRIMHPHSLENLRKGGRRPGIRNKATVARELAASAAIAALTEKLSADEIAALTPKEVLASAMIILFRQGRLIEAANVAEKLAPFVHPRVAPEQAGSTLPPDLTPDPEPTPDEDVPEHPVLG